MSTPLNLIGGGMEQLTSELLRGELTALVSYRGLVWVAADSVGA
ncbi:hypothetical protein [Mycobacterium lepromatosis]|nr:hypothetical protein [Mycobacterium lepromatosis]